MPSSERDRSRSRRKRSRSRSRHRSRSRSRSRGRRDYRYDRRSRSRTPPYTRRRRDRSRETSCDSVRHKFTVMRDEDEGALSNRTVTLVAPSPKLLTASSSRVCGEVPFQTAPPMRRAVVPTTVAPMGHDGKAYVFCSPSSISMRGTDSRICQQEELPAGTMGRVPHVHRLEAITNRFPRCVSPTVVGDDEECGRPAGPFRGHLHLQHMPPRTMPPEAIPQLLPPPRAPSFTVTFDNNPAVRIEPHHGNSEQCCAVSISEGGRWGRKTDFQKNKKKHTNEALVPRLKEYPMPDSLAALMSKSTSTSTVRRRQLDEACLELLEDSKRNDGGNTTADGINAALLTAMQFVEECASLIELLEYSLEGVELLHYNQDPLHQDLFTLAVPGLAEKRPSVMKGDVVHIFDYDTNRSFCGIVHVVNLKDVVISMHRSFAVGTHRVNAIFTMTRTQERIKHRAIEVAFEALFLTKARMEEASSLEFLSESESASRIVDVEKLTDEQRACVEQVSCRDGRRGCLLWGPPGTGKTTTVVSAVAAVLLRFPGARVLICAPSNDAADVVAERLVKYAVGDGRLLLGEAHEGQLLRVNGAQRDDKSMRPELREWSRSLNELSDAAPVNRARVVVATLMTANRLYSLGVGAFTHVMVDEAGHCTEAELLAALQAAPEASRVLLAGDHKQLGPVIQSNACVANGLGVSPLERLMGCCRETIGTMLTHNFRSTAAIVRIINAAYDDKLVACVTRPASVLRPGLPLVSDESGGVLLRASSAMSAVLVHHTWPESRELDSPSWCNVKEAHAVVSAVCHLMNGHGLQPKDIVVLSPYQKQVLKIRQLLRHRFLQHHQKQMVRNERGVLEALVEVSTVEMFQGREASAVLVSTVRNRPEPSEGGSDKQQHSGIGFLRNRPRANVALSRAQHVMLVFGNADLLHSDTVWTSYVERFQRQGAGAVMDVTSRPARAWRAAGAY